MTAHSKTTEVHGHRGAAGHRAQNSLQGFQYAVDHGVDAIEMDVVISKDKQVVVSHEPYMASDYVLTPNGKPIAHARERSYNLYEMEYSEIKKFDIGSKWDFRFFWKKREKTYKPLLEEVIEAVEDQIQEKKLKPVVYSIELKSVPREYGSFQPQPEEFINLVVPILKKYRLEDRLIIQSFDPNLLNLLHEKYPEIKISYLSENPDTQRQLSRLDFAPDYYSLDHRLIHDKKFVDSLKAQNIKVIAWTVNRNRDIRKMLNFGVDAIISDYPERVIKQQQK
ncbi:MAG: glycerophosphodiester phosphodiesterase family protein [Salinimicrobium sp.]